MSPEERPAEPGELCTCGRQARTVITTARWGLVGSCDIPGGSGAQIMPCPFCGATEPHSGPEGEPTKCPRYRLRPDPIEDLDSALFAAVRAHVERRHGLPDSMTDVLAVGWLTSRLAYEWPEVARALLARCEQEGATP